MFAYLSRATHASYKWPLDTPRLTLSDPGNPRKKKLPCKKEQQIESWKNINKKKAYQNRLVFQFAQKVEKHPGKDVRYSIAKAERSLQCRKRDSKSIQSCVSQRKGKGNEPQRCQEQS